MVWNNRGKSGTILVICQELLVTYQDLLGFAGNLLGPASVSLWMCRRWGSREAPVQEPRHTWRPCPSTRPRGSPCRGTQGRAPGRGNCSDRNAYSFTTVRFSCFLLDSLGRFCCCSLFMLGSASRFLDGFYFVFIDF